MRGLELFILFFVLTGVYSSLYSQSSTADSLTIRVTDNNQVNLEAVTIEMYNMEGKLKKTALTDKSGTALITKLPAGEHYFQLSHSGYDVKKTAGYVFDILQKNMLSFQLEPLTATMQQVSVTGRKSFIQYEQGKVIINPEASINNAGATVLDVLERSPGVNVNKDGSISLQGKSGVLVLIDDKQTFLSGTDLNNLLNSMSSAQVEQIELMVNPPAKYDAGGNAGIINIKTRKNKQKGFNGTYTTTAGQGVYPKNNNSLMMNYRNGKFNSFLNYTVNLNKSLTDIYAYRRYFDGNGAVMAILDQPTYYTGRSINNTLKTGIDYYISPKTTLGFIVTGVAVNRKGRGDASAIWLDKDGKVDSTILTYSSSANKFRNGAVNVNFKHSFNKKQEFSFDIDGLKYDIDNRQQFSNQLLGPGGYSDASQGNILTAIDIFSAKADHLLHVGKMGKLESGLKSSRIRTDNFAQYQTFDGTLWSVDYGKTNHFIYTEQINSFYSSFQQTHQSLSYQLGLRYEHTSYEANQKDNPTRKDSLFSRNYQGLFPSGYISYKLDSVHSFSFTASRRIDRPPFQKLNPFVFIINKYTYQTGNSFIVPQYSWNMELSHQYKSVLSTTFSYSILKNYFSQLFLTDSNNILIYSEGNVGKVKNLGISVNVQLAPFSWWSFNATGLYNNKRLDGFLGKRILTSISQFNLNLNNQFKLGKVYTAELSGFYTGRARNDLQEVLYPTGQLSVGVSRPVLKKKGTLRFSARDLFYTQAMEGLTDFTASDEYFIIKRDSRLVNLAFTYRFGKTFKTNRRNTSAAADEMQRVGNGN